MCACGCFILAAAIAAIVYSAMHGLWIVAVAVLIATALIGWLSGKMFQN
jgi:hypothetical protein